LEYYNRAKNINKASLLKETKQLLTNKKSTLPAAIGGVVSILSQSFLRCRHYDSRNYSKQPSRSEHQK